MDVAGEPDWAEFSGNLAVVLDELPPGAKLILSDDGGRYAQFAAEGDVLNAEISSDEFLAESWRMSETDHEAMVVAGWSTPNDDYPNWYMIIKDPGSEDCALLAEKVVAALQAVLRVTGPAKLTPDGWVDGLGVNNGRLDVTGLGLGPGTITKNQARVMVHWYILDRGFSDTTEGLKASRINGGWRLSRDEAGALEFYASDDHIVEHRLPDMPAAEFQTAFEQRYRERNRLDV
ncbi:TY-Chap domain-containing protein [Actinomadura sp. HBU206391]|uniref:TY-Chap domain-containing protein n=1 Tax=Actinomadura sp. HBU206391 TaxID=2731692 RepID=UPI00164F03D6|nr:hypothetical protein [Actinomadura sp. HBU206391]MBC6460774.1 hypothetical protein [Actinomadura sp. HBU206391]